MKLNIGAGGISLAGYHSIDVEAPADFRGDFMTMSFEGIEAVEMSHVLEHISHHLTLSALDRVRSWMVRGAPIRVEVPDIAELLKMDPADPRWAQWWFGSQDTPAQDHRTGFTEETLRRALTFSGFREIETRTFVSELPWRDGYPCLEAKAIA